MEKEVKTIGKQLHICILIHLLQAMAQMEGDVLEIYGKSEDPGKRVPFGLPAPYQYETYPISE